MHLVPLLRTVSPIRLSLNLLICITTVCLAFDGLLDAASELSKDGPSGYARPLPIAPPTSSLYPHTSALLSHISTVVEGCPYASLGTAQDPISSPPTSLPYITLTSPSSFLASHLLHRRTRAVYVFGESPREAFVTPAIALTLVEAVCGFRNDSRAVELARRAKAVLQFSEIVLVPLANPKGRKLAEAGSRCETRNARNVDLNKNWPHRWRNSPALDPSVRTNFVEAADDRLTHERHREDASAGRDGMSRRKGRLDVHDRHPLAIDAPVAREADGVGATALSEPETRALRVIVAGVRPSVYVSVQSGFGVSLTGPGECRPSEDAPRGADADRLFAVSDRVVARHCAKCNHASLVQLTGRGRCGSAADYMFFGRKTPFVYTWRVYSNPNAAAVDCLRAFNPVTHDVLQSVTHRWADAILTLTDSVHTWVTIQRLRGVDAALRNASQAAVADMAARFPGSLLDSDEAERVRFASRAKSFRGIGATATGPGRAAAGEGDIYHSGRRSGVGGDNGANVDTGFNSGQGKGEGSGRAVKLFQCVVSLLAVGCFVVCLFVLRSFVFSSRFKPYRAQAKRRASRVAGASDWMKVL